MLKGAVAHLVALLGLLALGIRAQENAASYVVKSLLECYNVSSNYGREITYPYNIVNFVEIIRKVETGKVYQNDREISKEILHRFKQDGIMKLNVDSGTPYSIPYTPRGFQADKNGVFLRTLVPGNAFNFPNDTVNAKQRCAMHFMLSNSLNRWKRGDEDLVCSRMFRYQSRTRRDASPKNEVEIVKPIHHSSPRGNLQEDLEAHSADNPDNNVEQVDVKSNDPAFERKEASIPLSDCPLEYGVIYPDTYGAVQIGTVISGIAAGRTPQKINIDETQYVCDNRYAATLAGDLAEAALHQGVSGGNIVTGRKGYWNSTILPNWYFIDGSDKFHMTDAEIRGGLDGLIMGLRISEWKNRASSLSISSLLEMYYSPRGVFSSQKIRSCNRYALFTEVVNKTLLEEQTIAFSFLLNRQAKLTGTLLPSGIIKYSEIATSALIDYIPKMPERYCEHNDVFQRAYTNIMIMLDTTWEFDIIQPALAYLLNNLEINRYASNFNIINARDMTELVNNSNSILEFYDQYNRTVHDQSSAGFDISRAFQYIQTSFQAKLNEEKVKGKVEAQSWIVLFVPHDPLEQTSQQTAISQREYLKSAISDIKFLVLGQSSKEQHAALVTDVSRDAFDLPSSTDSNLIIEAINPTISRIKTIPRRLINPNCGSSWSGGSATVNVDQYIDPRGIHFYRIAPNYFYSEGSRDIKVKNYGYGPITVCMSRQNELPSSNSSENTNCQPLLGANEIKLSLPQSCSGYDFSSCPPVYISVQGNLTTEESTSFRCTDSGCRYPDDYKYSFTMDGLDCSGHNTGRTALANLLLLTSMVAWLFVNSCTYF